MNEGKPSNLEGRCGRSSTELVSAVVDSGFGLDDYNVRTGIDVRADGPGAAMAAAVEEMGLRDAESFCFHVEHLRTGRKWYVDLLPSGEIDVQDWGDNLGASPLVEPCHSGNGLDAG
jgi:hypothetical protein